NGKKYLVWEKELKIGSQKRYQKPRGECRPKSNIVFIKTHKCASSSVQNIFMRYGYNHDKTFVLPAKGNYLGHPSLFRKSLVPAPSAFGGEYNILTHHSRLDYQQMKSLMPEDTVFVSIVRNPISLFESMFGYYNLEKFYHFKLESIGEKRKVSSKLWKTRAYGKLGVNQMLFDFGIDSTHLTIDRVKYVSEQIKRIDSMFDLIMVAEYMDESLVLLKDLLCWETDDVVALKCVTKKYLFSLLRCMPQELDASENIKQPCHHIADELRMRHIYEVK
ncbi:galactosylceramide sulfotransferase-like protein, partial [Leptotrombidium deliense]